MPSETPHYQSYNTKGTAHDQRVVAGDEVDFVFVLNSLSHNTIPKHKEKYNLNQG